ncbi:MAG: hypothetical protein U0Q15_14325 [Kineosporiaceae bacterium]
MSWSVRARPRPARSGPAAPALRDTVWSGLLMIQGLGPLHRPDPAVVRERWAAFAATPMGAGLPPVDGVVVEEAHLTTGEMPQAVSRLMLQAPRDRPTVVVGADCLLVCVPHQLGDGAFMVRGLVPALASGRTDPAGTVEPRPLVTALRRSGLLRSPRRLRAAAAHLRASRGAAAPAPAPPAHLLDAAEPPCAVHAASPAGFLPALKPWRASHLPGVGPAALITAGVRLALEDEGFLAPHEPSAVLFDLRRHLGRGALVRGSLTAALRLPGPVVRDPRALDKALADTAADGLPLLSALAATAGAAVRRLRGGGSSRPEATTGARPAAPLAVTITHLGRNSLYGAFDWRDGAGAATTVSLEAASVSGDGGITVLTSELGGRLHVTVCSGGGISRAALQRVADRAAGHLTELIVPTGDGIVVVAGEAHV